MIIFTILIIALLGAFYYVMIKHKQELKAKKQNKSKINNNEEYPDFPNEWV